MSSIILRQPDTIAARSTAPGPGAIAIIRVDGSKGREILGSVFKPRGSVSPLTAPRTAVHGSFLDAGSAIDDGIAIFFPGPHSFTGNDLVELHCHGGSAIVRAMLALLARLGARPAEPGEFTRRAFLNGKMDLAQAEAVADLIRAETDAAARAARAQLAGNLSREIQSLRHRLIDLAAEIEARIDFPEEGIEEADLARLSSDFEAIASGLATLLASRGRGKLLREGARVVLVGSPNVGKSSLLNALARQDRAIVSPHPGTTRDTIECTIDLAGIAVTLIDTAGVRHSDEPIEQLGIERTRRAIEAADCLIEIRDATGRIPSLPREATSVREPDLIVFNKSDLSPGQAAPAGLQVSAVTGQGIPSLESALESLLLGESQNSSTGAESIAVSQRHALGLGRAAISLAEARRAWISDLGGELVMIDLRDALSALDEILGLTPNEAILDRIFERFCLGK